MLRFVVLLLIGSLMLNSIGCITAEECQTEFVKGICEMAGATVIVCCGWLLKKAIEKCFGSEEMPELSDSQRQDLLEEMRGLVREEVRIETERKQHKKANDEFIEYISSVKKSVKIV